MLSSITNDINGYITNPKTSTITYAVSQTYCITISSGLINYSVTSIEISDGKKNVRKNPITIRALVNVLVNISLGSDQ